MTLQLPSVTILQSILSKEKKREGNKVKKRNNGEINRRIRKGKKKKRRKMLVIDTGRVKYRRETVDFDGGKSVLV